VAVPNKSRGRGGRPSRSALYKRLYQAIGELHSNLGGLPTPAEAESIWHGIWLEEAHNSTAIEGNTLVLRQVERLLDEGRAVGNKDLGEYMEVRGYANAAEWVYRQASGSEPWTGAPLITLTEVRNVHALALGPVWEVAPHPDADEQEAPGSFRRHDIEPFPEGMRPPPWPDVRMHVDDWVRDARKLVRTELIDLPEALARLHVRFEQIHPFLDGNGRTGRLLTNLLLVRLAFPPALITTRVRERYLRALRRADQGDHGPLGELIARAILDNLYKFIVPAVAGPARLVPLQALAQKGRSVDALRVAATRGRLRAVKADDGSWRSSRAWVDEYVAARYKRE